MNRSRLIPVYVSEADWDRDQAALRSIRHRVFVDEQKVPEQLEWDGLDDSGWHWIARDESGTAIGTARLVPSGQIGRMAVLATHRNQGIGARLLAAAVSMARELSFDQVFLHAQTHAIKFYHQAGFQTVGEEFDEAGIAHRLMLKDLKKRIDPLLSDVLLTR